MEDQSGSRVRQEVTLAHNLTIENVDQAAIDEEEARLRKQKRIQRLFFAIGGVLFLLSILMLVAIWRQGSGGILMPPNGNGPEEVSPTPAVPMSLTLPDLEVDSDSDAIPDKLEQLVGYDPQKNDCVREVGCGDFPALPRAKLRLNLVFVLDASGSMQEKLAELSKWESAIQSLDMVIRQGFTGFTEVALIAYGHRGSASEADRDASCTGVELVSPLQPWSKSDIMERARGLSPTGWTPLAGGLREAKKLLETREGEGNFVVLLSDGKETCGSDPVAAAKELHEGGIEVTTNVVGLAVSDDEKQQLEAIAQAGGGKYFPANNPDELQRAIFLSSEVVRLWEQINKCIVDHLAEYGQCVNVQYLKSINYLRDERLKMESEQYSVVQGTKAVLPAFVDLERRMWAKFEELRNENWRQYLEDLGNLGLPGR